ncbi:MAG: B12-binding domain-containing radical SAM protein [Phycisphaerales bacterium]|nr:MAG: B12-binding domain-containing radical SAM protein [Phycisphaerales bacterium]
MKVLLVNPDVPETFWGLKNALKFISKKSILPPLGLLTVAGMLPKDWEIKLLDMTTTRLRDRDIRWADYVFVTAMLIQQKSVDQVIERCKKLGTRVAAGGPLFTSIPEQYVHVDHLVLKEAELTLPHFIRDIEADCARKVYNTHERADLCETPIPRWSLIDPKKYALMCIQYSRGCPFDCDFCDVTTLFGHRIRTKSTDQVLLELESIYSLGWRGEVFFVDDNFIGNKGRLKKELLPAMIDWMKERQHPFSFNTQASINLADDEELMKLMVQAGFDCVFIGIETPSEESLAECNKVQNKGRNLVDCVKKIQESGMQVQGGFILGFDSDDSGVFDNLIQFIQKSGIVMAMVGLLNAPRGTRLYQRLFSEQRLTTPASGDNTDCSINFVPKMGLENLVRGYQKVIHTLYSQKHYCERIKTFLKSYESSSSKKVRFRARETRVFLRSLWHIGILSKDRRYYWRLILWAMRRRNCLRMSVIFSIHGYHFRKIFKKLQKRAENLVRDSQAQLTGLTSQTRQAPILVAENDTNAKSS